MFSTFNSRHHLRLSAPSKSCKYSRRCMHLENHRQFLFQHDQKLEDVRNSTKSSQQVSWIDPMILGQNWTSQPKILLNNPKDFDFLFNPVKIQDASIEVHHGLPNPSPNACWQPHTKNSWQALVQNHQLVLVMFSLYSPKYDMKPTKKRGFNNLKSSSTSETISPSLCNLFQRICHYNLSRFQCMQA